MNLLTFAVRTHDNPFLMQSWIYPVLVLCVVVLTAALVPAIVALQRAGRRAERVLALVEREIEQEVPPLMASLRALTGEAQLLIHGVRDELQRIEQITERVQELGDSGARLLTALSGLTRAGQLVGIAAGVKTGLDVFFHRLRRERGDGHG